MLGGSAVTFSVDAAYFDGTNDYARRVAGLTGAADSKLATWVGWMKSSSTGGARIFCGSSVLAAAADRFDMQRRAASSVLKCEAMNSGGTVILNVESSSVINSGAWICVMLSVDLSDTAKRHLYFGDANELTVNTFTNDTMDFTLADWSVGAQPSGSGKLAGDLAQIMFWPGTYLDLSVQANRRLFYSGDGKPVDPTNAIATLGAPIIYMHLDDGETANNFVANNDGGATGGTFTVTGALTTSSTSPSD